MEKLEQQQQISFNIQEADEVAYERNGERIVRPDIERSYTFTLLVDQQEVGKAVLWHMKKPPHLFLRNITIEKQHQSKGYGSQLMDQIEAKIKQLGMPAALENKIWGGDIFFYKKRGWEDAGFEDVWVFNRPKGMSRQSVWQEPIESDSDDY